MSNLTDFITRVVSDVAYGAGWDGDTGIAPSKNAVYDKIETISITEDYHTATITCATSGGYTLGNDTLAYTKTDRRVNVQGFLTVTGEDSPVGNLVVSMPFAGAALTEDSDIAIGNLILIGHGGDIPNPFCEMSPGSTTVALRKVTDGGVAAEIDKDDVDTAFYVYINITYITAS